ncbi:hypothetical protein BO71DRAFT_488259 [Aspergillus ellipticus CBS 707.79]|uniref:PD-(D/E)XK nuclease-like domain-containing protein n=1 Tax=Aspergillus ellipticus CBS 707.79 TaxID=1448320 RepID=A0A319EDC5_9EURO|nr:hypothetical protein BO71DRAFT_488259 [Aspergillus ellipticus CBS 707.79]
MASSHDGLIPRWPHPTPLDPPSSSDRPSPVPPLPRAGPQQMDGDKRRAITDWTERVYAADPKQRPSNNSNSNSPRSCSIKRRPSSPDEHDRLDAGKRPRHQAQAQAQECPDSPSPSHHHDDPNNNYNLLLSPSPPRSLASTAPEPATPTSPTPTRLKAQLSSPSTTPRITFRQQTDDPGSDAAKNLLTFLLFNGDPLRDGDQPAVRNIAAAARKCTAELRSQGSWVMDVARPLLELAIGDGDAGRLESWSVQSEHPSPKYLPRGNYHPSATDVLARTTIDLVVGLPREPWLQTYERMSSGPRDGVINRNMNTTKDTTRDTTTHSRPKSREQDTDKPLSHINHPHTGNRLLGMGVSVKAPDGNLIEAQVQLAVWMAGLVRWGFEQRPSCLSSAASIARGAGGAVPPPVVGCTVVGEDWKFYIVFGVAGVDDALGEVRVWGPFSRLYSQTTTEEDTTALVKRLRRVMQYMRGPFVEQLLAVVDGGE